MERESNTGRQLGGVDASRSLSVGVDDVVCLQLVVRHEVRPKRTLPGLPSIHVFVVFGPGVRPDPLNQVAEGGYKCVLFDAANCSAAERPDLIGAHLFQ